MNFLLNIAMQVCCNSSGALRLINFLDDVLVGPSLHFDTVFLLTPEHLAVTFKKNTFNP
jgi:hypothetical protein